MWTDRRLLVAFCGASLLLNVFLVGSIIGRLWMSPEPAPAPRPVGGALVPPAHVQALPAEDRRRFRTAMAPHRPAIKEAREAHRAARRQIEADIAAPIFDRARIVADFDALRQSNRNTDEAVDAALVDALSQLPAQSRAALVDHARDERPAPAHP